MRVPQNHFNELGSPRRMVAWWRWLFVVALLAAAIAGIGAAMTVADAHDEGGSKGESDRVSAEIASIRSGASATKGTVSIRRPAGPPCVATGLRDPQGKEVMVACSTCHTTRQPNFLNTTASNLDEFHGAMKFSHGTVSCLSCHNERDYDALKLADGTRIEFSNVMTLCAQCHGPQMKAYQHGAHGGMNGYWDLTRGSQAKNNCIDCHDPHTPQFPKMQPTFKPRDRFLEQPGTEH